MIHLLCCSHFLVTFVTEIGLLALGRRCFAWTRSHWQRPNYLGHLCPLNFEPVVNAVLPFFTHTVKDWMGRHFTELFLNI